MASSQQQRQIDFLIEIQSTNHSDFVSGKLEKCTHPISSLPCIPLPSQKSMTVLIIRLSQLISLHRCVGTFPAASFYGHFIWLEAYPTLCKGSDSRSLGKSLADGSHGNINEVPAPSSRLHWRRTHKIELCVVMLFPFLCLESYVSECSMKGIDRTELVVGLHDFCKHCYSAGDLWMHPGFEASLGIQNLLNKT